MRLYDLANIMRSKNAGPFTVTIDIMFDTIEKYRKALNSKALSAERICKLYNVDLSAINIIPFEKVLTIKVAFPRPYGSAGGANDRDAYGSQTHFPLADEEI
jgi:hypothetical protein